MEKSGVILVQDWQLVGWGEERTPTPSLSLAIATFIDFADTRAPAAVNHPRFDIPVDAQMRPIRHHWQILQ
jgi:hypothetical protein